MIEMMIVICIFGILASIALPAFDQSKQRGRRTDGQNALLEVSSKMESYFYTNKTYTTDLTELEYASASNVASLKGYYEISVNTPPGCVITSCYELEATPIGAQLPDGPITLDSRGQKLPIDKW